jgi:hypothetical protein
MLAGLGGTLRMRAYQMDEHAGHALAVWRPFNTCLERHSRMNVLLTEISYGRRSEGMRRAGRKARWERVRRKHVGVRRKGFFQRSFVLGVGCAVER